MARLKIVRRSARTKNSPRIFQKAVWEKNNSNGKQTRSGFERNFIPCRSNELEFKMDKLEGSSFENISITSIKVHARSKPFWVNVNYKCKVTGQCRKQKKAFKHQRECYEKVNVVTFCQEIDDNHKATVPLKKLAKQPEASNLEKTTGRFIFYCYIL